MEPTTLNPRIRIFIGAVLLIYVLGMQLIGIQRPFLGHYATYQGTVMASIARNMVRENFSDIFMPKTDGILEGRRSLHLNQYPLPSLLTAYAVKFIGGTYEFWGRFQAVLFNLLSILLMFGIAQRFFGERIAWISAVIFSLSPLTVVYGQSFMSESSSLFFFLSSFYLLIDRRGPTLFQSMLSAVSFSIAIIGRLHWILFLPVFCVPIWWAGPRERFRKLFLFGVLSLALPVLWYAHTYFASLQASHIHTNLFLQMAISQKGSALWFRPGLYRAVGMILGKGMFAMAALPFFVLGIPHALRSREGRLCLLGGIGVGAALMILSPVKLIRHDFYPYAVFPFLAVIAGLGASGILSRFSKVTGAMILGFFVLLLSASAVFSFGPIFRVPENEQKMLSLAKSIRERTLPEESIIVGGESAGIVTFYADRPAWSLVPSAVGKKLSPYLRMTQFTGRDKLSMERLEKASQNPVDWLEYLRAQGASYFVVLEPGDFKAFPGFFLYVVAKYRNVSDRQDYLLYSLKNSG